MDTVDKHIDVDTTTVTPNLNEILKWDGDNWVPAAEGASFIFTLDSFTGSGVSGTELIGSGEWKAVGAITFNASYSNPPGGLTADVSLTGSATAWASDLAMTGTPPDGPTTNSPAGFEVDWPSGAAGTITFTITPSDSPTPATIQDSILFSNTVRYGNSSNGIGAQTKAKLDALTEVGFATSPFNPNESRSQTILNIATTANFLVFAWAQRLSGNVLQVQRSHDNQGYVTASFAATSTTLTPTVQSNITLVVNSLGFDETFECVTSRLTGLADGTDDFKLLTNSTAQNYIYWGELNKDAAADGTNQYTESDVESNIASEPGRVASNTMSSRSMTVNTDESTEFTYIAYPSRLGLISTLTILGFDSLGDFWIDANSGNELAITNDAGYTEDYYVYVSKNPGFTDPTTMIVTI
jgi:hypothetical protein